MNFDTPNIPVKTKKTESPLLLKQAKDAVKNSPEAKETKQETTTKLYQLLADVHLNADTKVTKSELKVLERISQLTQDKLLEKVGAKNKEQFAEAFNLMLTEYRKKKNPSGYVTTLMYNILDTLKGTIQDTNNQQIDTQVNEKPEETKAEFEKFEGKAVENSQEIVDKKFQEPLSQQQASTVSQNTQEIGKPEQKQKNPQKKEAKKGFFLDTLANEITKDDINRMQSESEALRASEQETFKIIDESFQKAYSQAFSEIGENPDNLGSMKKVDLSQLGKIFSGIQLLENHEEEELYGEYNDDGTQKMADASELYLLADSNTNFTVYSFEQMNDSPVKTTGKKFEINQYNNTFNYKQKDNKIFVYSDFVGNEEPRLENIIIVNNKRVSKVGQKKVDEKLEGKRYTGKFEDDGKVTAKEIKGLKVLNKKTEEEILDIIGIEQIFKFTDILQAEKAGYEKRNPSKKEVPKLIQSLLDKLDTYVLNTNNQVYNYKQTNDSSSKNNSSTIYNKTNLSYETPKTVNNNYNSISNTNTEEEQEVQKYKQQAIDYMRKGGDIKGADNLASMFKTQQKLNSLINSPHGIQTQDIHSPGINPQSISDRRDKAFGH